MPGNKNRLQHTVQTLSVGVKNVPLEGEKRESTGWACFLTGREGSCNRYSTGNLLK
jgi:hypothetical protein